MLLSLVVQLYGYVALRYFNLLKPGVQLGSLNSLLSHVDFTEASFESKSSQDTASNILRFK